MILTANLHSNSQDSRHQNTYSSFHHSCALKFAWEIDFWSELAFLSPMRTVDSRTSRRKSTFNVLRNYQDIKLRRIRTKIIFALRIHSCLSDSDERRTTVRNRQRADKKAVYLLHRNTMRWGKRRQNVFTRPGEAILHRTPMIGTQAAGKHYSIHRNEIFFRNIFLYIPFQNFFMPSIFSKISFAPKQICRN